MLRHVALRWAQCEPTLGKGSSFRRESTKPEKMFLNAWIDTIMNHTTTIQDRVVVCTFVPTLTPVLITIIYLVSEFPN